VYIPKHFEETRVAVLHALVEAHPLGTLVTMGAAGLIASHIPMVLELDGTELGVAARDGAGLGMLRGHVSRANPQWREFCPEVEALAIFSGPEHYITPAWYAEKAETGKVVPTWNYSVVDVYGRLRVIEDAAWLRTHVERLTNIHEAGRAMAGAGEAWKVGDAPEDYVTTMLRGIVGLEIAVSRMEGKWKVSQNRGERDREGVAAGLGELETESGRAMKALVEERKQAG
jgi:transcriptional regulator